MYFVICGVKTSRYIMDVEQSKKKVHILAVDIERVNNEVVAIGGCIMEQESGTIIDKFKVCWLLPTPGSG